MPIDEERFKRLKPGFDYIEKWDRLFERPDKRIVLAVTIPAELKKKLKAKSKGNLSRYVEKLLEKEVSKDD